MTGSDHSGPRPDWPLDLAEENVRVSAAIYASAMLEEAGLFAVTDRVAEQFMAGTLPIGRGPVGDGLYRWARDRPSRVSESERRALYGRVLGLAQNDVPVAEPNRDFTDLWCRFLTAVQALRRQRPRKAVGAMAVSAEHAHRAGRDLAVNLSAHGYGVAHPMGAELQEQIRQMTRVLSRPELHSAYGASDMWHLVERVSATSLDAAANVTRYRAMAESGSGIIGWLADQAGGLADDSGTVDLADPSLMKDIERWLTAADTEGCQETPG